MKAADGISWDDRKRRTVTAVATATAMVLTAGAFATSAHAAPRMVSVIVRAQPGDAAAADQLVTSLGGHVDQQIALINSLVADVPATALPQLNASPHVAQVTSNAPVQLLGSSFSATGNGYNPVTDVDSMYNVEAMDGAHAYWDAGDTGQGVGVALIDSGVTPVNGLETPGKVVYGPDFSSESRFSSLRNLDTFGHGTHMAGIIAGLDNGATVSSSDSSNFMGMAPNAQIVSIKVANALGETDVSRVLSAISWVVQHQSSLNIGVLNLSYGTDSNDPYVLDPLAYAAEQAWLSGIVVVVAAGNEGNYSDGLEDPAIDPYVIAVGAADTEDTTNVRNDQPASFTSEGDGTRNPDLAAPGTHIVSLRDPGSFIDDAFGATAAVGSRFFLGSGTSQAAAVVSGAAALLLSQNPSLTPDQVKALLVGNTTAIHGSQQLVGSGELNLASVLNAPVPTPNAAAQHWPTSNGGRSNARFSPYGPWWSGASWSGASWSGASWSGASWSGASWSGASWSGASWSGASWSGASWSGASWSGSSWSDSGWN
ncbi:MAG TPA: S8 family serine peptidase [Candidatus Dormibacteraeota bacterium]